MLWALLCSKWVIEETRDLARPDDVPALQLGRVMEESSPSSRFWALSALLYGPRFSQVTLTGEDWRKAAGDGGVELPARGHAVEAARRWLRWCALYASAYVPLPLAVDCRALLSSPSPDSPPSPPRRPQCFSRPSPPAAWSWSWSRSSSPPPGAYPP